MPSPQSGSSITLDSSAFRDPQIAAVLDALNQGEIQQAQIALTRAASPDVKQFARAMTSAHHDMLIRDDTLFSRLQITPSDNAVSNQLRSDTQGQLSRLQAIRKQDEFDRQYMAAQVINHTKALDLIDRMVSDAQNPELKADLLGARAQVEDHLRHAERVQQLLANPPNPSEYSKARSEGGDEPRR
jgi:putative membrane protein